jgi:hypothetical protein
VEVSQGQQDVSRVEAGVLGLEPLDVRQVVEQFTALTIVKYKVELFAIFEGVLEAHYEGMTEFFKHTALRHGVLDLLELPDDFLLEHFHGV